MEGSYVKWSGQRDRMAQQKKTDTGDTSAAWESLTDNQRAFVVNLASGMTQISAYRNAGYSHENMSDPSIRVEASRLRNSPKIALILDTLAAESMDAAKVTMTDHLSELARLRMRAEAAGNYGAAVQAEQLRGKAGGLYVEQHRHIEEDPLKILDEIRKLDPELADALQGGEETKH